MKRTPFDDVSQHIPALQESALRFTNDVDSAKDLVQETMLKAIRHYEKFEEGTNLKGWLFTILRNTFINKFHRTTMTNTLISQTDELSYAQLMPSCTNNGCENRFMMEDIKTALSALPDLLHESFMRHVEGYKYHEIALKVNAPIGTIRSRIFKARRLLKKHLYEYQNIDITNTK